MISHWVCIAVDHVDNRLRTCCTKFIVVGIDAHEMRSERPVLDVLPAVRSSEHTAGFVTNGRRAFHSSTEVCGMSLDSVL